MEIADTHGAAPLAQARNIALGRFDVAEQAEATGNALVRGGLACLEIARATGAQIRAARRVEGLLVGAGDVHTPQQAEEALRAGAHFGCAPVTNMEVVHACRELELPFFPGAATPSEIERLVMVGVRAVRVFPAETLGGAAFLHAVAAIYPDVAFVPAGGIGPESLRRYLSIPSVLAVAGSGLVRDELLRARNFARIEWLARDVRRVLG
jgi:2-dehydro-3-deoxyphosphogluconate aldolase/(4S)-4-hydroxy-2-oxoglutarate aldolase